MNYNLCELISPLIRSAKTHGLLATEAAAIADELDSQGHLEEAVVLRVTARNHRIRQLELSANVAVMESLYCSQPSRS